MDFFNKLLNAGQAVGGSLQTSAFGTNTTFGQKPGANQQTQGQTGRSNSSLGSFNTRNAFPPSSGNNENVRPRANSSLRMSGPPSDTASRSGPSNSSKVQAVPSVDLTGLTAEEQAQIAAVMAKANAMESDIPPPAKPPPSASAFHSSQEMRNNPMSNTSGQDKYKANGSGVTPANLLDNGLSNKVETRFPSSTLTSPAPLEPPSQLPASPNSDNIQQPLHKPVSLSPERTDGILNRQVSPQKAHSTSRIVSASSKSPSRDLPLPPASFSTSTSSRPLQDRTNDDPSSLFATSSITTSLSPVAGRTALPPEEGSRVEWCPLCKMKELKIVVVHGKTQPLIGQSCAICGLIVCFNCGRVQKDLEQQKAYWICNECGDDQYDTNADPEKVAATLQRNTDNSDGSFHQIFPGQDQRFNPQTNPQSPIRALPLPYEDEQGLVDHDEPYSLRQVPPADIQFHSQYTEPFEEEDDNEEEWMTEQSLLRNDQSSPALGTWPEYPPPGLSLADEQWDHEPEDFVEEEDDHYDDNRTPHGPLSDFPSPDYEGHLATTDSTKHQTQSQQPYQYQYPYLQQEEDMTSDYGSQVAPVASGSSSSGAINSAVVISDLPSLSNSTSGDIGINVTSPLRNIANNNNNNNQNWSIHDQEYHTKISPTKTEEHNGNGNNIRRSGLVQNFRSMASTTSNIVVPTLNSPTMLKQPVQLQAEPFSLNTVSDSPDSGVSELHRAYAKFRAETQQQGTSYSTSMSAAHVSNISGNSPSNSDNIRSTQNSFTDQNQMYVTEVPSDTKQRLMMTSTVPNEATNFRRPLEVIGTRSLTIVSTNETKTVSAIINDFESMRVPMLASLPLSSEQISQPSNNQPRQALSTHPNTTHIDYPTSSLTSHPATVPTGQVNINPFPYRKENLASYVDSPSTATQRSQQSANSSKAPDVNTVSSTSRQIDEEALTLVQRPLSSAEASQTHSEAGSTTSTMNRCKRRLPLLPRHDDTMFLDDSSGSSLTPEEQQRQKQELKRRLSSNFYKFVPSQPRHIHEERRLPPLPVSIKAAEVEVEAEAESNVVEWNMNGLSELQETAISHHAARHASYKRKKHKHLPLTPQTQECPKVQLLKQQLFMLAARRADRHASHSHSQKPYGSLPNRPLSPPYELSSKLTNAASSTEVHQSITKDSAVLHKAQNGYHHRLHKKLLPVNGTSQSASDPQIFNNILKQYRQLKKDDELDNIRQRELGAIEFEIDWRSQQEFRFDRPDIRDRDQGPLEDPKLQSLLHKFQQINRSLNETKELFRSTSRLNITALENEPASSLYHPCDLSPPPFLPPEHRRRQIPPPLQRHWSSASMIQNRPALNGYNDGPYREQQYGPPRRASISNVHHAPHHRQPFSNSDSNLFSYDFPRSLPDFVPPYFDTSNLPFQNNNDLNLYEPYDDPYFLPMGTTADQRVPFVEQLQQTIPPNSNTSTLARTVPSRSGQITQSGEGLAQPLVDSRVSFSTESPTTAGILSVGQRRPSRAGSATRMSTHRPQSTVDVDGLKDNVSEAGSGDGEDALNSAEQLSRSMSTKRARKDVSSSADTAKKYNFATKKILLTRDPKDRSASGNGLGVRIAGGKLIPNSNTLGAFISKIWDNGIMATLDQVKEGDQVLEWNGVPLTNKSYEEVQEILEQGNGEVDMLVRCDYNVRSLEIELEQSRNRTNAILAQTERARLEGTEKSALPSRSLFSGKRDGSHKGEDAEEVVYRPPNQLAPPSPAGMQRKKSTSSGHAPVTGDIMLRMTYERCTLTLQVIKARNLKAADKSGFSDPYCKINLVPGRASEYKYRTRHIMQTLNPEWKETFTFQSIDPNEIHHKQIEITVWDWDRLSADDFLGEVIVDLTDPVHLDGTKRWYPLGERRPGTTDDM